MRDVPISGPWRAAEAERFLVDAVVPLRLAFNGPDGFPRLVALWFLQEGDALWCAAHESSWTVRSLARDARCAFDVSVEKPPYFGVRGQAEVSVVPERGLEVLGACLDRYLGGRESELARWLLGRGDREVALRIEPRRLTSWDYRERMGEAEVNGT